MFVLISYSILLKASLLKGGASYCYCAYFCASRDTQVFLSVMLSNRVIFLCGLKLSVEKKDLFRYHWYPKRKYGVTVHFDR